VIIMARLSEAVSAVRGRQFVSIVAGFALCVVLCTVTDIDRHLAARFYQVGVPAGWFLADALAWRWLYQYGEYPGIVLVSGAFLVLLGSAWCRIWASYRRHCLILLLSVALGPGVVVNGLLKSYWGRPRPRHIVQFGGTQTFRPWWQPGGPGAGKSFPSGHAAMGYVLFAGATLVARRRIWLQRLAVGSALAYGTLLGLARIVQGGHFLSDVVWSGLLVTLLTILLHRLLIGSQSALAPGQSRVANPPE
jgi:membrane-associated PAP2 superfamily phosphatase